MKPTRIHRTLFAAAGAALISGCGVDATSPLVPDISAGPLAAVSASGAVTRRSLDEFLAAQGTFCADVANNCASVTAPVPEFLPWFNGSFTTLAMVDYAGLANAWLESESGGAISLGTTVDGSVTERVLKDGSVEVHVILRTKNALTWAGAGNYAAGDPVLFGASPTEVLAGATPVLGTSTLNLKYITTAPGLPLSDILQIAFAPEAGQAPLQVEFHAQSRGVLRTGSGFPDGTMGSLLVQQVGIFRTKSPSKAQNPFVVEIVELKANGS